MSQMIYRPIAAVCITIWLYASLQLSHQIALRKFHQFLFTVF